VKRNAGPEAPWRQRLETLASQWSLEQAATGKLAALLVLVRDDSRAATSVRPPAEAVDVHVADSLSALPLLDRVAASGRVTDIGSGAGFPGLPIAIARPGLQLDLIESGRRKCEFMESAARALGLDNVAVVNARVEERARADGRESYDVVLARAVAPLATLAEYAAPLLVMGGALIAWKGEPDAQEEQEGASAAKTLGLRPAAVERVRPYPGSHSHHLHLYEKVRVTPPEFPRRPGMARKHPLS
jgi:16S rRNA (guanine527-N7)-methyltransferase